MVCSNSIFKIKVRYIFAFIIIASISQLKAQQLSCIDSLSISPGFPCPNPEYYPVCGCDQKTYRNVCDAQLRNGVRTYTDGSCSGFEFDLLPTYSPFLINFTIVQTNPQFARLFIVDMAGRVWIQREISAAPRTYLPIEIGSLNYGTYLVYVYNSQGTYRYKKFVRVPG